MFASVSSISKILINIYCTKKMEKSLKLNKRASLLAIITIVYNLVEGIVSVFFGAADETLSLFGFGIDSFVEVLSGIGIWNMVRRMKNDPDADSGPFEKRALQITGISSPLHCCLQAWGMNLQA